MKIVIQYVNLFYKGDFAVYVYGDVILFFLIRSRNDDSIIIWFLMFWIK